MAALEIRWTFAHEGKKYKIVLVDFSLDICNIVYDPGFVADDLGIILQASYFLNGYWWHPDLTDRQIRVLQDIQNEAKIFLKGET